MDDGASGVEVVRLLYGTLSVSALSLPDLRPGSAS